MTPHHMTSPGTGYTETSLTIQTLVGFKFEMDCVHVSPDLRGAVSCVEDFTAVLAGKSCRGEMVCLCACSCECMCVCVYVCV